MRLTALAALSTLTLGACSLAPDYQRPDVPTPPAFNATDEWKPAQPADAAQRGAWWTIYNDPVLNDLQDKLGAGNQSLRAGLARLEQARASARSSRADYLPSLDAGASHTRQRVSQNRATSNPAGPKIYNDNVLSADLSYEIDLFGRVRNSAAAAENIAQASAADLATLELSLRSELAIDYFALRADDAGQTLLDESVEAYQKAYELTQNRYNAGASGVIDVSQAETTLQTARTQASDIHLKRTQLEHAVAVLTGQPPEGFHLPPAPLQFTPPPVNLGLPSTLLERRPDVAAAERRVTAANAQIGVARAAYFPSFNLSAMAGLASATAGNWLEAPSQLWSIGPGAALSLFDGGRRRALNAQARAAYDETVADYRQTVLDAYRDVEDNLTALAELERQDASQTLAVKAANRTLEQVNYRYKGGVSSYLEVVTAQNAALQAQQSAIDIQTRRASASVLLIKALGGDWSGASSQDATH